MRPVSHSVVPTVVLHPGFIATHRWPIMSGLQLLAAAGEIDLRLGAPLRDSHPAHVRFTVISRTESVRRVVIDLVDGSGIADISLRETDVLLKRSFVDQEAIRCTDSSGVEVRPFGLSLAVRSPDYWKFAAREISTSLLEATKARSVALLPSAYAIKSFCRLVESGVRGRPLVGIPGSLEMLESVNVPTEVRYPIVTFQVAAWNPAEARSNSGKEDRRQVTEQRAAIIRLLRSNLGSKFIGGFTPSDFAVKEYPDCVAPEAGEQREYWRRIRAGGIAVSSRGLSYSNPYKLGEYLAAGSAIVTERLHYGITRPELVTGGMVIYDSPEQCAELCVALVESPQRVHEMRRSAHEAWHKHVRPDQLLRHHLASLVPEG